MSVAVSLTHGSRLIQDDYIASNLDFNVPRVFWIHHTYQQCLVGLTWSVARSEYCKSESTFQDI